MTWLDCGIGTCACGTERRLYETEGEKAMCLPCVQRWSFEHSRRALVEQEARRESPKTTLTRVRRRRLSERGLCYDCGRLPPMKGVRRCMRCHQNMLSYRNRASQ